MTELVRPHVRYHRSFLDAARELDAEGSGAFFDLRRHPLETLRSAAGFAAYVRELLSRAPPGTPRPADHVPDTVLWVVAGEQVLGRVSIRHALTPLLLEEGGHIGYAVRPSARRQGHATAALRLALAVAHDLGIDPALLICDEDHTASRLVIERGGGRLEDVRAGKRRYWLATGTTERNPPNPAGYPSRVNAVAELLDRARVARIRRTLRDGDRPARLGILLDCSELRATAREALDADAAYRTAAAHADELLGWCEEWDIDHLAVHVVTAGVLRRGQGGQVGYLRGLVEAVITDTVAGPGESWRLEVAGDVSLLPASTVAALRLAVSLTRRRRHELTISIGHPGDQPESLDAADLVLTPPLPLGPAERDLAEALLDWSRADVGRAG